MIDWSERWHEMAMLMGLLSSRMLAAFSVIPLFLSAPGQVRSVLVASLTVVLLPLVLTDKQVLSIPVSAMIFYAAKEMIIGLVLGLMVGGGFWAMYCAGTIVEYQAGLSMATTIDPLTGQDESLVGGLFMQLFTILFLVAGGLLALIGMLYESYRLWPLTSMTPVVDNLKLVEAVVRIFGEMLVIALKVATPFLILMLLVELAFGLLSRFAPQLNVFFLALPLKVLILAAMMLLYAVVLLDGSFLPLLTNFTRLLDPLRGVLNE